MPQDMPAQWNHQKNVLKLVQRHPGISKPQLCQLTGLTPSAIHTIMGLLEKKNVVSLAGAAASSGGRRAMRYTINNGLGAVLGISIRIDQLEVGIFDLQLHLLHRACVSVAMSGMGPETYTSVITQAVRELISKSGMDNDYFLGIGVSIPGPVEYATGTVQEIAAAPLWQQFPLADRLSDALRLPVIVDKDVYSGIRYLEYSGKMRRTACTAYLSICEGIGSAVLIHGEVFRGSHSLCGEIGHLTVRKDGIPCSCGNTGCLELYCSDIGIVKQYNAQSGGNCQNVEEIIALVAKEDPIARKVFSQAVGYLVDTTLTIVMNYDPEELLIYCTWLNQQRALYFRMLDALYARSIFTRKHAVDIRLLPPEPINLSAAATLVVTDLMYKNGSRLMALLQEELQA